MIKPVFIEFKRPSGNHPGHVLEEFYAIDGDVLTLVIESGETVKDPDGRTYSRELTANGHPKVVASRLLRSHYEARRNRSVNGFGRGPIYNQKMKRA
jgi:hypothetical protein